MFCCLTLVLSCAVAGLTLPVVETDQRLVETNPPGLLQGALGAVLPSSINSLLFAPTSPVQYTLSYDYTDVVNSLATISSFLLSPSSPGYYIANFDYAGLAERITPNFVGDLARRLAEPGSRTASLIISTLSLIIIAAFLSFLPFSFGIFYYFGYYFVAPLFSERAGRALEARNIIGELEATDELLDNITDGVMKAVEYYKVLQRINGEYTEVVRHA